MRVFFCRILHNISFKHRNQYAMTSSGTEMQNLHNYIKFSNCHNEFNRTKQTSIKLRRFKGIGYYVILFSFRYLDSLPQCRLFEALLTLLLRTCTSCWRFTKRPIESATALTSGPSANVSKMASKASQITHKLNWPLAMSRKTVPRHWKQTRKLRLNFQIHEANR